MQAASGVFMEIAEEVTIIPAGRDLSRQSASPQPGSREWYFRASAEFSACVASRELERIMKYTVETDTHAHNLAVLWMTDPFPEDIFVREAQCIVDTSKETGEIVDVLKDTAIRFVHATMPDDEKKPGTPGSRRRIVHRRTATGSARNHESRQRGRGNP